MKKLKLIFLFIIITIFGSCFFYNLYFDKNITNSKYTDFKNLLKRNNGGIVYNNTSRNIQIIDNTYVVILPPHKNSREIGIFDTDGIVINNNMSIHNKIYSKKILKFCDFGRFKITNENNQLKIEPFGMTSACKFMNDFGIYNSIKQAFTY